MKHNKEYDWLHKWVAGPGGINCSCCTFGHPNFFKPRCRRTVRRKAKQNLQKDIDN